jgi:hypothetical protein
VLKKTNKIYHVLPDLVAFFVLNAGTILSNYKQKFAEA